jgi:hypothetical protein
VPEHGDDLALEALGAHGKTAVRRSADLRQLLVRNSGWELRGQYL